MSDNIICLASRKQVLGSGLPMPHDKVDLFETNVSQALYPTTPQLFPVIPEHIATFCRQELGCLDVLPVRIIADDQDTIRSIDNVDARIARNGGKPVYGWKITASRFVIRAEFHVVVETGIGMLDVTPDSRRTHSCFAVDPTVPDNFDFFERPGPYSVSTYVPATKNHRVAAAINAMDVKVMEASRLRAAASNLSLEDLIGLQIGEDRLSVALSIYLNCVDDVDAFKMRVLDGMAATDLETIEFMLKRKAALEALVSDELRRHPMP